MFIFSNMQKLTIDNSVYLTNIYSGNVIKVNHKNDLQHYYRRSSIPSKDNEYIYDYKYSRIESILRMLIGKYKRNKILDLKQIHEYDLCYEFYRQYCPRIISFQNISKDIMERVMSNKTLSIEFWLDKIVELSNFNNNQMYYLDMVGTLFRCSPYINELYNRYYKLNKHNTYFMYNSIDIMSNILKNHKNLNIELFEKILEISINKYKDGDMFIKSLCECDLSNITFSPSDGIVLFQKHKNKILEISGASEYTFYDYLLPTNIDIDDIFSFMDRDYLNRTNRDYDDIIRHILIRNINYTTDQLKSILFKLSKFDNLGDRYNPASIVFLFENKQLSREIIKSIIIPKIQQDQNQNIMYISEFEDIIVANPNVYREDLVLLGINIYECQPDYLLLNTNMNISNKEIFDNIMFNREYDNTVSFKFLSYPRITESDIIYFIDRYISYISNEDTAYNWDCPEYIFKWITRNPNLTELALSHIINASKVNEDHDTLLRKVYDIDWPAVFNNQNISIKYIEKVFRNNPDLFA